MPKGVEFEADDTDSTCDSDSILTTSPVFTRAPKTKKKFNFTLDNTDSDSDVISDTPQPKRLRPGICINRMHNLSDNLNRQEEPEPSAVESRQNGESCRAGHTKQASNGGNMLKKPQLVHVSSSDNDSDLNNEWLRGAAGKTNTKSTSSERFSKGNLFKTADEVDHGHKRVTPKLTKQRTFIVSDSSAPPLPTLSPRAKSLQKLVELRKQRSAKKVTAAASAVKEEGAYGNSSESRRMLISDSGSETSDEEFFESLQKPTANGGRMKPASPNHFSRGEFFETADEVDQGRKRVTPKLTKQRTFVVSDSSAPPLPTLSPRAKSLQKLVELRKQRSAKKVTAAASAAKEEGAYGNSSESKRMLILDSGSETSDEEFFGSLLKPTANGGRIKSTSSNHRTKNKEPLPKRGRDKSGDCKKSAVRNPKKSAEVTVVTLSDSESSPDISEEEFERRVNGFHQQREGRPRNSPGASVTAASASTTSTDCMDISEDNSRRRSRNRNSSQGRSGFVAASTLLDTSPRCSPSRPCRRSCPCKDNFTRSTVTSETRRSSPKKKSLNRPDRPSANRWQPVSEASGANDSIVNTVRAVTQMEKDEEMARRMQEDMDRQYAAALASGAATTPQSERQRSGRLPASIALDDAEEMEARINMLTDWEWQVHVSIVQGTDVPPVPPGEYRQSPDEALDPTLLEHLYSHPDAINLRRTTNNRTTARPRIPGIPPVVLPERNLTRSRGALRRSRGGLARRGRRNGGLGLDFTDGMLNDTLLDNILFTEAEAFFDELSANIRTRRGGRNILDGIRPRRGRGGLNMSVADGNDYEELLALEEQLGAVVTRVGLSAEQISRLPLTTYKAATASSDATQCHVCMSDYEEGDRLRLLTCFHSFHCDCIDQWIKDNPTCPVCRIEVQV